MLELPTGFWASSADWPARWADTKLIASNTRCRRRREPTATKRRKKWWWPPSYTTWVTFWLRTITARSPPRSSGRTFQRRHTGSSDNTGCFRATISRTTREATVTDATGTATTRGTKTPWTFATAGTNRPSIRPTSPSRWSSSSQWFVVFSDANQSIILTRRLENVANRRVARI